MICNSVYRIYRILTVFQALKIESGFTCLITLFIIVSILPLLTLFMWACSKPTIEITARTLVDEDGTPIADTLIALNEKCDTNAHCRRILQFSLNIITILLL